MGESGLKLRSLYKCERKRLLMHKQLPSVNVFDPHQATTAM